MKTWLLCSVSAALMLAPAQVLSLSRDQVLRYTPQNPFERFPDGRTALAKELDDYIKSHQEQK